LYYSESIEILLKELDSSKQGLSSREAHSRKLKYGDNTLKREEQTTPLKIFLQQFSSMLVLILVLATVLSAILGYLVDSLIILGVVILNAVFGFIQDYKAEKSLEALRKLTSLKSLVIRDNKETLIDSKDIVPGDILILKEGDKIPADSRIIELKNLQTNESSLTGESTPLEKQICILKENIALAERKNMVFSGTIVTLGYAKVLVIATGMNTEIGKIAHLVQTVEKEKTPLQLRLQQLGKYLGISVLAICALIFSLILFTSKQWIDALLTSLSLAVAAIPEGLPAVVTISLALGLQRLARKNALIRKLPAVETLGSTDFICTDKTGTLTKNEMTITQIYCDENLVDVTGKGYDPKGHFIYKGKVVTPTASFQRLLEIGMLCNNARVFQSKNQYEVIGDPTEASLLVSARKFELDKEKLLNKYPLLEEIPFTSERKIMTTIHKNSNKKLVFSKFAVEKTVHLCTKIQIGNKIRKITKEDIKKINQINDKMTSNALRVLSFAYKEYTAGKAEQDLIFVGLQAMIDPPRKEVKDAVKLCHEAGIKVVMITGDHKNTAIAIADQVGIKGQVLTGDELEKLSYAEFKKIVDSVAIYARVNPEHKLRIVTALQSNNHVVAMTGDGINDAPALKKADIGIAMGIAGTDVSKEASDMVLADDNFATIVNTVKEGRAIYDNIQKFIQYLLSSNLAEILVILIASLFFLPLPLLAIHLLWLNLVTDGLPALALSVDPASTKIMSRKPRPKKETLLPVSSVIQLVTIGFLIAIFTLGLFRWKASSSLIEAQTLAFTALVFFEIVRLQVIRSNYGVKIFSNKWLNVAVVSSLFLQFVVVYTPLNQFFKTVPLSLLDLSYIFITSVVIVIIAWLINKIIELFNQKVQVAFPHR
jgi:Ca2+-transporting ATPase